MTIFGGVPTDYGNNEDGFFVVCAKCGWHSMVTVQPGVNDTVVFTCHKCDNIHIEGVD
jgi:RNase P subunit RPR2